MISERSLRFCAVLSMAALFVAGVGVGFAIDRMLFAPHRKPPPRWPPRISGSAIGHMLDHFSRELDLRLDQKESVRQILEQSHTAAQEILTRMDPMLDSVRVKAEKRITTVLDPDQAEKYRHMMGPLPPPPGKVPIPPGLHRPPVPRHPYETR